MTELFVSHVCDWCDGLKSAEEFTGYIVWRDIALPAMEYVFPSATEAVKWRKAKRLHEAPIRAVKSRSAFRWRPSRTPLVELVLADRVYEIHPDASYSPAPQRAHLSEDD